ncbi:MAG: hypothetical protein H6Q00_1266 [Holophagaceae bacterium]|nr:hypothetical protein [Holophagaceae bacterium]
MILDPILPSLLTDGLLPPEAAYMARTDLHQTRMLGYTPDLLDSVTALLLGVINGRSAVRHEAGVTPPALDLMRRAGLAVEEETLVYRTPEEAWRLADGLADAGKRFFWPYPAPEGRFPNTAHLVPVETWRSLNAKASLADLVPPEHLAPRQILSHQALADFEPTAPVYLKSAGDLATGWGFAVRFCPDRESFLEARDWMAERHEYVPAVIVEEAMEVERCWCASLGIVDAGATCFGGAEQLFASPGHQSGSLIDPGWALPEEGRRLAERVGEAARRRGFRGLAGLDIGRTRDGRLIVFDPNFRFNSSTTQVLFHDSAAARSGLPVSLSFQVQATSPFDALVGRLHGPVAEGWFIPTRAFDAGKCPAREGRHIITGFVLAPDRQAAEWAGQQLAVRLLES